MIKAILFDLDGVLWNSSPHHARAYRKTLKAEGIRLGDYRAIAGLQTEESMRRLLKIAKRPALPWKIKQLSETKRRHALALLTRRPPLTKGLKRTLNALKTKHIRLGLVSSSGQRTVTAFQKALGRSNPFSVVLSARDSTKSKPHPAPYQKALKALRLRPHEVWAVEDSKSGVQSARRAGLRVWGLIGTETGPVLKKAGAHRLLNTLSGILRHVVH